MSVSNNSIHINEIIMSLQRFSWLDYSVFALMLIVCTIIGIYFGFVEKKAKTNGQHGSRRYSEALDYLVGGRKMQVVPIAISLVASWISGITMLGITTEVYLYGTQYMYIIFPVILCGFVKCYVLLPVFHELKLTTIYEYLELRFDKRLRLFGSVITTLATVFWLPIVIYVPALAFNQVSGIDVHIVTPVVCILCIFYTCVGGIKAVVWTDVFQCIIMYGVMLLILIRGIINLGGFGVLWERNWDSGRIEAPESTLDLTVRHSILSISIGGFFFWVKTTGANQSMVQRYLSLQTMKDVRKTVILYLSLVVIMLLICGLIGLLMYATYYDCDPLKTKLAKAKDQLLPLYVIDILRDIPCLPGFFVAGVFSAALSSLSTSLNAMSAVVLIDFVKPFIGRQVTEIETRYIMRITVCVFGAIATLLVLVVEKLGTVLQLSMSINGIMNGPLCGLFVIGLLLPWINGKSALTGTISAFICMVVLFLNAQSEMKAGTFVTIAKPTSIDGCKYEFSDNIMPLVNQTLFIDQQQLNENKSFSIYHISYLMYMVLGTTLTIVISALASIIFGTENPQKIDPMLLAPFMRRCLRLGKSSDYSASIDKEGLRCVVHTFNTKDNQLNNNKL